VIQAGPANKEPISVGWVLGLHGTSGEVRVRVFSDVSHRFNPNESLCCNGLFRRISASTPTHSNQVILKLEGIDSPEAARDLVGQWLTVPPETSPQLPEGEYFHYQLLGLRVITEEGEELGEISEILETGSNDVYVVSGVKGDLLIPAISQVVREIDLTNQVMLVSLLEGMR
jgi:16S rRNA processing protein RimM